MYQCSTELVNFRSLSYAVLQVFSHLSKILLPHFVQAFKSINYLGSTKIGFHKQFVLECKGCLIALKDRLEEDCACFELLFYHERQSLTSL